MTQYLLKNSLSHSAINRLATAFSAAFKGFNAEIFRQEAHHGLGPLELKQRVQHIIDCLHRQLPKDFKEAAPILSACADHWPEAASDEKYPAFASWPLIDYIGHHGTDHPELALPLLKKLTELFSAEFAIQAFLLKHFALTHATMLSWTQDENYHVRRLACEGLRPRLPWGLRMHHLCKDPSPILPVLHQLKNDPSLYVRKSVANNLNDISKDNPNIAIHLCQQWLEEGASKETLWIIKHGCRGLIKSGNPHLLALLGFHENTALTCQNLLLDKTTIRLGQALNFQCEIQNSSTEDCNAIIDYAVFYPRQQGKYLRKVFKLNTTVINAADSLLINKTLSFKPITTRRYYAGQHRIELLVNGRVIQSQTFELAD